MKAQTLVPWICVLGLAAGVAAMYVSGQKKDDQLTALQQQNQEAQGVQTKLEEAQKQIQTQTDELETLRKDKEDLLRLRNEVRQLQDEKAQLTKQAQAAQADVQRIEARATQAAQAALSGSQQLQQLQSENQQLRTVAVQTQQVQQRNACINNLRMLDGAKQQWALEHGKTADAVPTTQDIAPYLQGNIIPACPAGGAYTLNSVGQEPTCSIAGHALPKSN